MSSETKKPQYRQAGFKPIQPEVVTEPVPAMPIEPEPEPTLAYTLEFACSAGLFKQAVKPFLDFTVKQTDTEDKVTQWLARPNQLHTYVSCALKKDEPKTITLQWHGNTASSFDVEDATPHANDTTVVSEAFVPLRPAIQCGEQLGLPTEGYLYHFLEGALLHEYRCLGENNHRFQVTRSRAEAVDPQVATRDPVDFIVALWKKNGAVVTDQHLFYSREPLTQEELDAVDPAFLEQHGVKLDMKQIIPLTEIPENRKKHTIVEGDTLWDLAITHQTDVETLLTLNPYWRGKERILKIGETLYLEPVTTYNHGADVTYPTDTLLLSEGTFAIGEVTKKSNFPVVTVAVSGTGDFTAISPVRYAIDTLDDKGEAQYPLPDTSLFPGGIFKSDSTCYTLRQLRDGWLYALYQSPKTQEWQLEEYQVTQSELARIPGLTADERVAASPEPLKTHLLLSDSQSYFLGYSVKRWSQRICDHYLEKEAEREQWLRKVELSQSNEHRIGIEQIEQYVADVAPESSDDFKFTCAPFNGDSSEPNDFICITSDKNEASYRYQAPSAQQQQLVALDDPLGDLSDLYLALLMPILITTLDDETQHKVVMAETIRSIARAAIPADKVPDIEPEQWTEFESALDTCLEFHYFKTQYEKFKSAGPSSESARMSIQLESQACRDAYPEAKQTLTKMGFTDIQPYLESYIDRRKAHQQVNWSQLDDFYKTHLMEQAKANSAIKPAFQALLTAIPLIGTDPMNIGIDLLQGDHMAYLLDLFGEIVPALNTIAQDEQQQTDLANAIVQDTPDNLLALASSFFSADLYTKTDELAAQTDVVALQRESVPISGVVAGLNGVMGYGMGADSGLLKHTLDIVTPADQLITSTQAALKGGVLSSWQKMSFILLGIQAKKGGYRAGLNIAIMTWSVEQVTKGKLGLNPAFEGTDTPFRQRFVDTVKEIGELEKTLKKSIEGSNNYIKSNNRLEHLIKRLAGMVEDNPVMFDKVNNKAITKPASLFGNMNAKFNSVGRVDFVVAFANAINVIVQQQTLSDTLASAPEIDASGQLHVLGFSSAWLVHATGDIFRGMAFDQMKQVDGLLDKSLKSLVKSSSGSIKANTVQLAKAYVNRSMLVGMAGFVAAGWEAFRTYEDAKTADSEIERYLTYAKATILGGQATIWGIMAYRSLATRFLMRSTMGLIFQGWMAAGLFWLGFAYLMVSLILNYLKKTPLETWLLNSTWGKEPKDWTPEEEYQALLQLLNQPQIQSKAVKSRNIEGKMAEPYKPLPLEYQQRITLTFPQQSAGKLVGIAINVHQQRDVKPLYGYGTQQQTETTTIQLNDTHLAQGSWAVDESNQPSFTFDVPTWLQSTDSIDFLVSVTGTNPFANEQTVAQTYQSRIKPGLTPINILMKDLEKLNLTDNNIITLKIE